MTDPARHGAGSSPGSPFEVAERLARRAVAKGTEALRMIQQERRNARVIGELTVRAVRQSRVQAPTAPVREAPAPQVRAHASPAPVGSTAHLGVAEILAAIPTMTPEERRVLLDEERAGRNRSRVIERLEELGA